MNLFGLYFLFHRSFTTGKARPDYRRLFAEKRPLDDFSETLSTRFKRKSILKNLL